MDPGLPEEARRVNRVVAREDTGDHHDKALLFSGERGLL